MVKWQHLAITALMVLCLLAQHTRLREAEARLAVLSDCCQRQELQLKQVTTELDALKRPEQEDPQTLTELVKQYAGFFDDHDVSGLLEEE